MVQTGDYELALEKMNGSESNEGIISGRGTLCERYRGMTPLQEIQEILY